jgi:hypothetical protein
MSVVYLPKGEDGEWINENAYLAYRGFHNRGYEIRPYTPKQMSLGALPLTRETIVHGGVEQVRAALKQLGVAPPRFETYPYSLRKFMDRNPSDTTLGAVIEAVQAPGFKPCFMKPQDQKAFTGLVVSQFSDLLKITHVPETSRVWKLPVIEWLSEYRAFIHKGELAGMRHYKGDPLVFPNASVVRKLIKAAKVMPQVAFSLDVGVANFPHRPEQIRTPTLLVEANDSHSLGAYGLPSHLYCQMIEDRWKQMVETGR